MEVAEMTWYNLFFWLLASILKFVVTPSAMIASGHSAWTTWAVTASGSALGVLTFWRFGTWWFQWLEERMGPRPSRGKRIFNPRRRRIVKMKNLFGLRGLLLASGLISVPLAAALGAPVALGLDICKYHTRYHNNQVREAQVLAQNQLMEWEQILMQQPFFQGPRLGMIDIACFPFIRQFANITPDIFSPLPMPKIQQWLYDRCHSEIFKQSMLKN